MTRAHVVALAATGLLCLGVGFWFGHSSAPSRVVTVDHSEELMRLRAENQTLSQQLETAKQHTTRETVVTYKDGKPAERRTKVDTESDRTVDTRVIKDQVKAIDSARTETKTVTVEHAPQWFVGPLVVWIPTAPLGQQFAAGVTVGRHLIGPLAAGVSLTVPVHKPVSIPAVGLAITVAF